VVDDENHHSTDNGDEQTIQVQSGHSSGTKRTEQPPAYDGTHNAEENIENQAFPAFVYQLTADESGE
jgi:hypothetical protein